MPAVLTAPVIFDLLTDRTIPERAVSYYEGPLQMPVLRRALQDGERTALDARAVTLRAHLAPFGRAERKAIVLALSDMLRSFPQMQRRSPAEALGILDGYFGTLAERPGWAIIDACALVRAGKIPGSVDFAPSEARLNAIVGEVIAPYRGRLHAVERLLGAKC